MLLVGVGAGFDGAKSFFPTIFFTKSLWCFTADVYWCTRKGNVSKFKGYQETGTELEEN